MGPKEKKKEGKHQFFFLFTRERERERKKEREKEGKKERSLKLGKIGLEEEAEKYWEREKSFFVVLLFPFFDDGFWSIFCGNPMGPNHFKIASIRNLFGKKIHSFKN